MKTKEFIEKVEALNFVGKAEKGMSGLIGFPNTNGEALISVNEELAYHINTDYKAFRQLHLRDKRQLADIAWEYASTPLEEREEEKKYRIELKNDVVKYNSHGSYLNLRVDTMQYMMLSSRETSDFKTQFIQKEIDNFPVEVKEVLPLCEKIEVTDNDVD